MELNFEKRKVMLTETILRDAHQSQAATRMRMEEMLPMLEQLDEIGYYSIEAWGGATFDSCLRFLNEDPWERLRTLKAHLKTPIQMLLRGQNLLGYRHYADDVVAPVHFISIMIFPCGKTSSPSGGKSNARSWQRHRI